MKQKIVITATLQIKLNIRLLVQVLGVRMLWAYLCNWKILLLIAAVISLAGQDNIHAEISNNVMIKVEITGMNETKDEQCMNLWVSPDSETPPDGDYDVKIMRDGEVMEVRKRVRTKDGVSYWFGGCRPFCENDIVLFWKRPSA